MMKNYSAHWRITVIIAIILHIVFYTAVNFALPYISPELKDMELANLQEINVDLTADELPNIEEVPQNEEPAAETSKNYEFPPIFIPPSPDKLNYIEPIKPKEEPPLVKYKPESPPPPKKKPKPKDNVKVSLEESNIIANLEGDKPQSNESNNILDKPPVIVNEVYPNNSFDYTGYVIIAVTVGIDGKVHDTAVMLASGIKAVDDAAVDAANQWTFSPALNQDGLPMPCEKMITFNF